MEGIQVCGEQVLSWHIITDIMTNKVSLQYEFNFFSLIILTL